MIAFEVSLNDNIVCTAGVEDFGVLTAIVSRVRRRPEKSRNGKTIEEELSAEVGGLDDSGEHLNWLSRELQVGDCLSIKVIDIDYVDAPVRRYR